jgi:hypothetical protein
VLKAGRKKGHRQKDVKFKILTLFYSSKINGYFYLQRVSPPLKKKLCDMFSEVNAAHPVGCDSPIVLTVWRKFFEI